MPKSFKDAVAQGARIRTKQLSEGRYIHIAYLDGKSFQDEVKKKRTLPPGTKRKK